MKKYKDLILDNYKELLLNDLLEEINKDEEVKEITKIVSSDDENNIIYSNE